MTGIEFLLNRRKINRRRSNRRKINRRRLNRRRSKRRMTKAPKINNQAVCTFFSGNFFHPRKFKRLSKNRRVCSLAIQSIFIGITRTKGSKEKRELSPEVNSLHFNPIQIQARKSNTPYRVFAISSKNFRSL
jgi:hypothetical protein